ncbi:MAG: O-antigen ligase family protein [Planctomycetes bacterium]|nr:O-antigen ligase family protein [Planctomycetota bacterium]
MSGPEASSGAPVPRGLVWTLLVLLVVPFDPFWIDFEQVRRGLLLVLAGACLLLQPRLPAVRGEVYVWSFVLGLCGCGGIAWLGEAWFGAANQVRSFQPVEALFRIAHWLALLVVLRLGAVAGTRPAAPLATVLLLTSLFGLLQRAGLAEVCGYGVEREPVSVFGNLNVASEWTAVGACAVAVLWPAFVGRQRWLAFAALGLGGAYLVVNQSRSGLVALPVGLALLFLLRRKERPWQPGAAALAGAVLGLVLATAVAKPEPVDFQARQAEHDRATSTLAVRFEIAKGATKLWADSPVFGRGPAQFAVHYPRVRSQAEIEASSHGRQFATEVRTAHDDWLELLVDGGLVALLLFAGMLFGLQRERRDKAALVPLFALLLLMLVRAPLWNAPAAAVALLLVGTPAVPAVTRRWMLPTALLTGLVLVGLGVSQLVGHHHAARWQAQVRTGADADIAHLQAAAWWMPFEPRWLQLQTQLRLKEGNLQQAAHLGARALTLRPFDPTLLLQLGEVLARGNKFEQARDVAKEGLRHDPRNPELRVLLSTTLAQQDAVDDAIATVVDDPHELLRVRLARHFRSLAELAQKRERGRSAARFLLEHHVQAALDALDDASPANLDAANEHVKEAEQAARMAERRDARPRLILALLLLDKNRQGALQLGEQVAKSTYPPLTGWQRAQFGDRLARLDSFEGWARWLAMR